MIVEAAEQGELALAGVGGDSPTALDGRVAVVTGAGRGIGRAVAERLAAEGAKVVLADLESEWADAAAAGRDRGQAVSCDVTDEDQTAALVSTTLERHGRLDIAVANAGVAPDPVPVVDLDLAEWRRVMSVNLDGAMLTIKHAARAMSAAGGGSIVAMSSVTSFASVPLWAPYPASKAALASLVKTAAIELRGAGVRVNAVSPGFVETQMYEERAKPLGEALGVEDVSGMIAATQGRLVRPQEVAALVAYLASDRASFCTGAEFVIDGGLTASGF